MYIKRETGNIKTGQMMVKIDLKFKIDRKKGRREEKRAQFVIKIEKKNRTIVNNNEKLTARGNKYGMQQEI